METDDRVFMASVLRCNAASRSVLRRTRARAVPRLFDRQKCGFRTIDARVSLEPRRTPVGLEKCPANSSGYVLTIARGTREARRSEAVGERSVQRRARVC